MKLEIAFKSASFITDNSKECNESGAFLLTKQNRKFLEEAKSKSPAFIATVKEVIEFFELDKIKIVGITGTNGKTTTAAAIYSILLDLEYKAALQGTRGFFANDERIEEKSLTTPPILATLKNLLEAKRRGCEYFIMEVSSHAISQNRIEALPFFLKVFTNISQDHLDYHKTMENYIEVKSSFFSDDSLKLINREDKNIKYSLKNCYTYALNEAASFIVTAYSLRDGIKGIVTHLGESVEFYSSLYGLFNLYNILAAMASVKLITKNSLKEIAKAVESFGGVSGRMEVVSDKPLVIVDFAHTPDGMEKVLSALSDRELIVVFGAGGDRDRKKRPLMAKAAQKYAKKIYVTSDNPRSEEPLKIIEDIAMGFDKTDNVLAVLDRKKAIQMAIRDAKEDEVVVILGKGDEEYQEIGGEKIPFDDRKIAKEAVLSFCKN